MHSQNYENNNIEIKPGDNILEDAKSLEGNGYISFEKAEKIKNYYNLEIILDTTSYGYVFNDVFLRKIKIYPRKSTSSNGLVKPNNIPRYASYEKLDVTNIASGMARFLAERAKAELTESFFSAMYKQMNKVPELQFYFPESYSYLIRINGQNLDLNIDRLRNNFQKDLDDFHKKFILESNLIQQI